MASRVGRPVVKTLVKARGVIPDVSSNQNKNDSTTNLTVNVFGTSADVSDAIPLGSIIELPTVAVESESRDIELKPVPPAAAAATPIEQSSLELHEIESFDQNPKLKRFKARTLREAEFNIDVAFLRHVIQTLIVNHNITITAVDVQAIMSFFGPVEMRTSRKHIIEREPPEPKCLCFGGSERTTDKVVEVVKKVIVQGVNIAKYVPALVEFMTQLGITL
jgi:hypothetical protein